MDRWRWLVWSVYLAAWTAALLFPHAPRTGVGHLDEFISPYRYAVAKTVHVSAYAVLAVLTGALGVRPRYRGLLVFVLMAHGTATEMGQWVMTRMGWSDRTGELFDVAYDNAGILIGMLVSWKWWTRD